MDKICRRDAWGWIHVKNRGLVIGQLNESARDNHNSYLVVTIRQGKKFHLNNEEVDLFTML